MDSVVLLKTANRLFRGLAISYSPGFVKGAICQLLSNVTVQQASLWVNENYSLLDKMPEKYRRELVSVNLGSMNWLTADWVIQAVKDKKPALASLFFKWRKGHNWLERQCQLIKTEFASEQKPD